MARTDPSFWYTLGRTVETAVSALPGGRGDVSSLLSRPDPPPGRRSNGRNPISGILAGATTAFVTSRLSNWTGSRRPRLQRLLRGAVAGAGAAGVLMAARVLIERKEGTAVEDAAEVADELLAAAGRGVLYASLLDPYLPGPPVLRGALAGTAEYLTTPWGGIYSLLRPLSPIRKVPVISVLLETSEAEDDPYVAFLLYGVMLGLFYGKAPD